MKRPPLAPAFIALAALLLSPAAVRAAAHPLIFQNPTISRSAIVFEYAGDLWSVGRDGGQARKLVSGLDLEGAPYFSPDGSQIAFSGDYDGNVDVYVVPAQGGEPHRLTYHPGADVVVGWTPDGRSVLFRSGRDSHSDSNHLYTVPASGGFPKMLPLDMAEDGSFSPDGTHIAYVPASQWEPQWQHYRGGQTTPIWIADLADSSVVKVPRENSNDRNPMWDGSTIYFLSDRNGPATLYSYDTNTQHVEQLIPNHNLDILSANAGGGAIVYTQLGSLHVYDIAAHAEHPVPVSIASDLPQTRPHWLNVASQIQNANLSPSGVRAVFEAHGEILTVPTEHGDVRNLTQTPAVEERDPAWSPDGRWIAYFSDASGEYALHIKDQKGLHPARVISLGPAPSFYYAPAWSPDSTKIAYADKHLNLWYVDVSQTHPVPVKVDHAPFEVFGATLFNQQWSPDSKWLTYNKQLSNFLNAVFVYSVSDRKSTQITDGMSDSRNAAFDRDGKYLYFLASTNTGLTSNGLDMESDQHPVSSSLYAAVLSDTSTSPIKAETGDEPAGDESADQAAPHKSAVTINFDGMLQRIVALPVPSANYVSLSAGEPGTVYLVQAPLTSVEPSEPAMSVLKFDLQSRHVMPIEQGISAFALSFQRQENARREGAQVVRRRNAGAAQTR